MYWYAEWIDPGGHRSYKALCSSKQKLLKELKAIRYGTYSLELVSDKRALDLLGKDVNLECILEDLRALERGDFIWIE